MKRFIIILGIILTSGLAALALSITKQNDAKLAAEAKINKDDLSRTQAPAFGNVKSNITNAD